MKKVAWFFPVSAGILWGSVGIFIRSLSGYGMDTATIVGSRTMISVILMLIGIAVIDRSQLKIRLRFEDSEGEEYEENKNTNFDTLAFSWRTHYPPTKSQSC